MMLKIFNNWSTVSKMTQLQYLWKAMIHWWDRACGLLSSEKGLESEERGLIPAVEPHSAEIMINYIKALKPEATCKQDKQLQEWRIVDPTTSPFWQQEGWPSCLSPIVIYSYSSPNGCIRPERQTPVYLHVIPSLKYRHTQLVVT